MASMRDEKVVFIRGTGRCGSKNLVTQLGHHPELAHVPVNQILPEELMDWSVQHLQASDERVTDEAVRSACRAYFSAYGRALAGRDGILLQKSTRNAHHLSALLECWPEAKIVYLVRHPFGVVEALVSAAAHDFAGSKCDYGYRATVVDSLLQWYAEIREYVDSNAFGHPRLMQVRFEALIGDPAGTVSEICRFLDIADTPLPAYGGPELYDDPFVLNEYERRWIIDAAAESLAALGYNPEQWSAAVPPEHEQFLDLYPQCRMHSAPPSLDAGELVSLALSKAAAQGCKKAGLFGAGYFTRRAAARLPEIDIEIAGIFDDNPALSGSTIAGLQVRPLQAAGEMGVDVLIPMTFVHQVQMIRRCRQLYDECMCIVPLWIDQEAAEVQIGA